MLDLSNVPLVDDHSHAGLYERRLGRPQRLVDLDGEDPHYRTSSYRALLREAYADLFGAEADWASGVDRQYVEGVEPAYSRMLDRLGIQATLWDFRRLGRDRWPSDRYRLVYWIDPFIFPFPDASLHRGEELQQALAEAGLAELPRALDDYLAWVSHTLHAARPRLYGLKLLMGYHRSLRVEDVSRVEARGVYTALRQGELAEYRRLQDFMARQLFELAGELDLPLQIHASFGGPGSGLQLANNDPSLLQPLLSDDISRTTRVVLLHGGYPFVSQAAVLAWNNPRVFLDWSVLASLFTTRLAVWLTEWLELLPSNKLLFGTDASSPELYYTAAVNGRRQLGAALDQLVTAGIVSGADAVVLAERVCSRNAIELYGLRDL
jgi:hypothetical protein